MTEAEKDTKRAFEAARLILDGRNPVACSSEVLVTLEHAVAVVLLVAMDCDKTKAAAMLNEGLLQGVEARLARYNL